MEGYLLFIIAVIFVAWLLGAVFTKVLIPFLEKKQFKQFVRELGPKSHLSKTGTPSMGGIAILFATVITVLIASISLKVISMDIVIVLVGMALFSLIGFIDDYEKAIKKNNLGLNAKQKIVMQFAFSGALSLYAYFFSGNGTMPSSSIWIPIWDKTIDLGILYIPFIIFVLLAFTNSVNLTDGLDGLASGVTCLVSVFMLCAGMQFGYYEHPIVFAALAGACMGFLMYNRNPAKIFMGDTGSMALGGALAMGAIMMKLEFVLAIAGLIYVIEALSVMIQVTYFKKTRKRIFKMAPIHHHFELCGMSERKVVVMFYMATVLFCVLALIIIRL